MLWVFGEIMLITAKAIYFQVWVRQSPMLGDISLFKMKALELFTPYGQDL